MKMMRFQLLNAVQDFAAYKSNNFTSIKPKSMESEPKPQVSIYCGFHHRSRRQEIFTGWPKLPIHYYILTTRNAKVVASIQYHINGGASVSSQAGRETAADDGSIRAAGLKLNSWEQCMIMIFDIFSLFSTLIRGPPSWIL